MPRRCSVCDHAQREEIDQALATNRDGLRDIAGRFGLSKTAVGRHKADHLPAYLARAQEAKEVTSATDLLKEMQDLQRRTLEILSAPENQRVAVQAIAQARQNVELLAKLTGELASQPTIQVAVVELPLLTPRGEDGRPRAMLAGHDGD